MSQHAPDRSPYPPARRPQGRPVGHIVAFVIGGIGLIVAGWTWDKLHSLSVAFMTQDQVDNLSAVFWIGAFTAFIGIVTGLALLYTRDS